MKWRIGDVTITRVVELTSSTIGNYILPQATEDRIKAIDWIGPFVNDDCQLVLQIPDRQIRFGRSGLEGLS